MLRSGGVSRATPDKSPPPMRCTILPFPPRCLRGTPHNPKECQLTGARSYTPPRFSSRAVRQITGQIASRLVPRPGRSSPAYQLLQWNRMVTGVGVETSILCSGRKLDLISGPGRA